MTAVDLESLRLLIDLKPALDGHAGIPNESRLLFELFSQIDRIQVTGLVQHGGRKLRTAVRRQDRNRPMADQIDRVSRAIVSLFDDDVHSLLKPLPRSARQGVAFSMFHLKAALGVEVETSEFITTHFKDFLWGLLFEKSLDPLSRAVVLSQRFELVAEPRFWFQRSGTLSRKGASSVTTFPKINTQAHDVFIAQTPLPARVSPNTTLIVRYHDAVPVFWPHTISDMANHQSSHFLALQQNVNDGAYFACTSQATRTDLLKLFPQVEPRSGVVHNYPSGALCRSSMDRPAALRALFSIRRQSQSAAGVLKLDPIEADDFPYLLMVSTFEPRKNHARLFASWLSLKLTSQPTLRLVLVGGRGWGVETLQKEMIPHLISGDIIHLENISTEMLSVLYTHAAATVCPSLAEGFDYSGIEAMRCGCPVIASDIPVHREIYGDACLYFDPYSAEDLARPLALIAGPEAARHRDTLVPVGLARAAQYTEARSTESWLRFLDEIAGSGVGDRSGVAASR